MIRAVKILAMVCCCIASFWGGSMMEQRAYSAHERFPIIDGVWSYPANARVPQHLMHSTGDGCNLRFGPPTVVLRTKEAFYVIAEDASVNSLITVAGGDCVVSLGAATISLDGWPDEAGLAFK